VLVAGCAATLSLTLYARTPRDDKQAEAPLPSFAGDVAPLVEKYCLRCHSGAKPKGAALPR
jgi:hypothetical protein